MREQLLRSTRAVRSVALALLLPVATACTSTSNVPGGGLGSIKHGVVTDHDGDEVRIDPNSDVRFQRTDGSWTPWRHASSLWVSDDGVLVPYSADIGELDRVSVEGLSETDLAELRVAAGDANTLDDDGGAVTLSGDLGGWLRRFVENRKTAPSGVWSFHSADGVWFDGVSGASLPSVIRSGLTAHDGLRYADMHAAEVKNLSGGKTLVAVVAVSAVAVGLVAVAVLTKGKGIPDFPLKAGAEVGHIAARTAVHVAVRAPGCCYGGGSYKAAKPPKELPEHEDVSLGKPGYPLPSTTDSYRLFDGVDRRRAAARFGVAIDGGGVASRRDLWTGGAVGLVRLTDLFELGGGMRLLGRGNHLDRVWLGRIGLHAELDARRRFALPLSLDFGAGTTVNFHARLNFGLRMRVVDEWWLGIYPVNPTYTSMKSPIEPTRWSFPTTIETSFAF
jgi:hypothetical protein